MVKPIRKLNVYISLVSGRFTEAEEGSVRDDALDHDSEHWRHATITEIAARAADLNEQAEAEEHAVTKANLAAAGVEVVEKKPRVKKPRVKKATDGDVDR